MALFDRIAWDLVLIFMAAKWIYGRWIAHDRRTLNERLREEMEADEPQE